MSAATDDTTLPLEVVEVRDPPRTWVMTFSSDELRLVAKGTPDRVVRFEDRFTTIRRNALALTLTEHPPMYFRWTPALRARIGAWIGPQSRERLQQRVHGIVGPGIVTGGTLVLWGCLIADMRVVALTLGVPLLVTGVVSRFVVRRSLFAALAITYAINVFVAVIGLAAGGSNYYFLLLLLALFVSSYNANEYRSFEGVDETGAN